MNKRDFLKNIALLTAGATLAPEILLELKRRGVDINYATKVISLKEEKDITLEEFYNYVRREFEKDEAEFPFDTITMKMDKGNNRHLWIQPKQ